MYNYFIGRRTVWGETMNNQVLIPGEYYHIYNRGNNKEKLFLSDGNYQHFLKLYARHVFPVADTFAYCLMPNHFHFLVRIKSEDEVGKNENATRNSNPSQAFSNLFNAYAKAFNKQTNRTGSLFQDRFKRILISSDAYFTRLVFYIHMNPQKHGFIADLKKWKWSSYSSILQAGETKLCRGEVLDWFDGVEGYVRFHQDLLNDSGIEAFVGNDE
jgi:REP element-mobilizing transposase RayT